MRKGVRLLIIAALGLASSSSVLAQQQHCRIEPFQGATLPQGAIAHMHITNTGAACAIGNFGVPAERRNPAESGTITSKPSHGSAAFSAPHARYTPEPGFVGEDEFTYEAIAKGNIQQTVRLKVRVLVHIKAP